MIRPVLLLLLVVVALLDAAPAPRPRPTPAPLPIAGVWRMLWVSGEYEAVFARDGSYEARAGEFAKYEGRWRLEGHTLTVEERAAGSIGSYNTWTATLAPGTRHGKVHGSDFRLSSLP